jgi:hypothetical protein
MSRRNVLDVANDMITHFVKLYNGRFKEKPIVNRGKMKYAMAEILQDWTQAEIKDLLTYYVDTETAPDLSDFCKRYDEIIREKRIEANDRKIRKQLLNETRKSVLEFREKYKGAK